MCVCVSVLCVCDCIPLFLNTSCISPMGQQVSRSLLQCHLCWFWSDWLPWRGLTVITTFSLPFCYLSVYFIIIPRSFTFKKMCVLDLIWFLINVTAWLSKKTSFLNHFPSITNPWIHSRSVSCAPLTSHPCAASLKTNYNLIMWQDLSFLFNLSNNLLSWKF